jgi:hypothetical protein
MTDEQILERIKTEDDAKLVFEGNGPLVQEFTDAGALWGYVCALRSGRARVARSGAVSGRDVAPEAHARAAAARRAVRA